MLSKRSTIFFFISALFIIIACSTESVTISPTKTQEPQPPDHKVIVPDSCHKDGYQVYVAMGGNYCFAYPAGYYIAENAEPQHIELRYYNPPPETLSIEEIESMAKTSPPTVSLAIRYEKMENEPPLKEFSLLTRKEGDNTAPIPWSLSTENAFIRKEVNEKKVTYCVYAKHGKKYYTLSFISFSSLPDQNTSATQLENLFFAVLETFTFID